MTGWSLMTLTVELLSTATYKLHQVFPNQNTRPTYHQTPNHSNRSPFIDSPLTLKVLPYG